MNSHQKEKNSSLRKSIGGVIIVIGFIFMVCSGEPMPEDPTILNPTLKSLSFGFSVMLLGSIIFGVKKVYHNIKKMINKE